MKPARRRRRKRTTIKSRRPRAPNAEGKPWSLYIVRCGDGTYYTGVTNDVERRLERHNAGRGARYTRGRLPVRLVRREALPDRSAALIREMAVKALTRREKEELIFPARRGKKGGRG